jgi:hypothetical protein
LVKIITDLESRGVFFESVTEKIETGESHRKIGISSVCRTG